MGGGDLKIDRHAVGGAEVIDPVDAVSAVESIVAKVAAKAVVTLPTRDHVVPGSGVEIVVATHPGNDVVASLAVDEVAATVAGQGIAELRPGDLFDVGDGVHPLAGVLGGGDLKIDRHAVGGAEVVDPVRPRPTVKGVVTEVAAHSVVVVTALNRIVAVPAGQIVSARPTDEGVVPAHAGQLVGAAVAGQGVVVLVRAGDVFETGQRIKALAGVLGRTLQGEADRDAICRVVEIRPILRACPAVEGVVAQPASQRVVLTSAADDVIAGPAPQIVEPCAARDDVVAAVAIDVVILPVAGQGVAEVVRAGDVLDIGDGVVALPGVLGAALQVQVHRHAVQSVVETDPVAGPGAAVHGVVAFSALEEVVASVSGENVIAAVAEEVVVPAVAGQGVIETRPRETLDVDERIVTGADGILGHALNVEVDRHAGRGAVVGGLVGAEGGLRAAIQDVVALAAFQPVVAAIAFQPVAARAAVQVVALGAAGQGVVTVTAVQIGRRAVVAQVVLERAAIDVAAAGDAGQAQTRRGRKRHSLVGEFDVLDVRQGVGALGAADRGDIAVGGDGVGRAQAAVDGGVRTATGEGRGRAVAVALDLVVAETSGEPVGAFAAEQQVIAVAAVEKIASEIAAQQVAAEAAAEGVVSGVAGDVVVVGVAGEGVGKGAAPDVVALEVGEAGARGGFQAGFRIGAEVDGHAAGGLGEGYEDGIGRAGAAIGDVTHADVEGVISVAAVQGIDGEVGAMLVEEVADQVVAGVELVVAKAAVEGVRTQAADKQVVPVVAGEVIGPVIADDRIRAGCANDRIGKIGAVDGEEFEIAEGPAGEGGQRGLGVDG